MHFPLPTLLHVFDDSDFGRGAHRVDASVSVTSVGPLVRMFHVVKDKAAVRRHLDGVTIGVHRNAIPIKEQLKSQFEKLKKNHRKCNTRD